MTQDEFDARLGKAIPSGIVLSNPGGGVSEVLSIRNGLVSYRRGSSTISISTKSLFEAFSAFRGKRMTGPDLKARWPAVFDSSARPSGHSCNVTFLFLALARMTVASAVKGKGVRGDPFYVEIDG